MREAIYKRALIKLSGEALAGEKHTGFDLATVQTVAGEVKEAWDKGVEIVDVDLFVRHDIRGDEFAAARFVKRLHGSVFDTVKFADDALDLGKLDAKAADLDLSVVSADDVDRAV